MWLTVVVRGMLCDVEVEPNYSLQRVFKLVGDSLSIPELRGCKANDCRYQKLRVPVERTGRESREEVLAACWNQDNWEELPHDEVVAKLWSSSASQVGHIYLVIELPSGMQTALGQLNTRQPELFRRLQIVVKRFREWTIDDVVLNGGIFLSADNAPREVAEIASRLKQTRTYHADGCAELRIAKEYPVEFAKIFVPTSGLADPTVRNPREFVVFYTVLRCYLEDASRIASDSSSSLKASAFQAHFIQPPFFACPPPDSKFSYHEQMPWRFPLFVSSTEAVDSWRKFTPNSDFSVVSKMLLCPFIIAEIVSDPREKDRYRMLLEGIAAARAGQHLSKSDAPKFFVIAIYLTANLHAERYILMEAASGRGLTPVNIMKAEFDLRNKDDAIQFLLEMFNMVERIGELEKGLDQKKKDGLTTIKSCADKMISLDSKGGSVTRGEALLRSIQEEGSVSGNNGMDLGVFDCEEVHSVLASLGYEIGYIAFGHPNIATVFAPRDGVVIGYLKFIKSGSKELEILQYLCSLASPANHTIRPIRVWPIRGGSVVSMPVAGGWLTSLKRPSLHLRSTSQQLFEAVKFMHDHGVAHLDLKPQNVIIPPNYGPLTIIDFSLAVRMKNSRHVYTGLAGTEGYMAPEVGKTSYNPIRADLWSCGKVIEELCALCGPSPTRMQLLEIAGLLLDDDPEKRPTMREVLQRTSEHKAKSPSHTGLESVR